MVECYGYKKLCQSYMQLLYSSYLIKEIIENKILCILQEIEFLFEVLFGFMDGVFFFVVVIVLGVFLFGSID